MKRGIERRRLCALLALAIVAGCSGEKSAEVSSTKVAEAPDAFELPEGAARIGERITQNEPVALGAVWNAPETYFEKKVLVQARADKVCQAKGCWMTLTDDKTGPIWVRWGEGCGGKYAFPKDAAGKRVMVEGTLAEKEISMAEARHIARESEGNVNPEDLAGKTFEIVATACVVLPGQPSSGGT